MDANGCSASQLDGDSDGDGVLDTVDDCVATPGTFAGCPVGVNIARVQLHIINQVKSLNVCAGKGSCKEAIAGAEIRLFDRNHAPFQAAYGSNPDSGSYEQIFDNSIGRVGACVTEADGSCLAGLENSGDFLAIAKYNDPSGSTMTGKKISSADFVDAQTSLEFQIIIFLKKNGDIQFGPGKKTVLLGSYLEIISLEYAVWENGGNDYVYPFIFTSDSPWDVDVCAEVPPGYTIAGVYNENGDLLADTECVQTLVANETKVVAFSLEASGGAAAAGSGDPSLTASFNINHKGKLRQFALTTTVRRDVVPVQQEQHAIFLPALAR